MPILDSKGRLFGRVNIIDLAALVLILVVLVVAVGARFRGGTLTQNMRFLQRDAPVVVTLVLRDDASFMADQVRVGDARRDAEGVRAQAARVLPAPGHGGPARVEIWLRSSVSSEGRRMYGAHRLQVGHPFRVELEEYQLHGYVESIEEAGEAPP